MIVEIKGTAVGILETKTKKDGKPYRVVSVLQQNEKGADVVRVNLWNGHKVENGKPVVFVASIRAFQGSRGGVMLSADVY